MKDSKSIEITIMMSTTTLQVKALKSVLTSAQLDQYTIKMNELKHQFIKKYNVTDPKTLELIDIQFQ